MKKQRQKNQQSKIKIMFKNLLETEEWIKFNKKTIIIVASVLILAMQYTKPAEFIAVCAVLATFWQAKISWEHNKLSVRPCIIIISQTSNNHCYEIVNAGVGPAIITKIEYVFNKKNSESIEELLKEELRKHDFKDYPTIINLPTTLSAGEKIVLLKLSIKDDDEQKREIGKHIINSIGVKIRYESAYKEEFNWPLKT